MLMPPRELKNTGLKNQCSASTLRDKLLRKFEKQIVEETECKGRCFNYIWFGEFFTGLLQSIKETGMELHRCKPSEWNSFMDVCLE